MLMLYSTSRISTATSSKNGNHVIIQLVAKGDHGHRDLEIMRYFNQPPLRERPHNHVLPVIEELQYLDMYFLVLPLLSAYMFDPPFYNDAELLEAMRQSFEVRFAYNISHSHI
jgi:hypothetical protein